MIIFNKRNDKCESKFWFRREEIQVVDKIKYLGCIFQSNGRWNSHIKEMLNWGRAAMFTIFRNNVMGIKNLSFHKRVFLLRIMPILHYGAEIWGLERATQIESVQLGYFKTFFGLHRTTYPSF